MATSYCARGVVNQSGFPPGLYNHMPCDDKGVHFTSIAQMPIIIANLIEILLALIAVLAVIFIIYAGIMYIISQGDPGRTQQAKGTITNAIIGVVLSASAYLVVDFLARSFS